MALLRVRLLGQFRAQRGEEPLAGFGSRKVQELFGYLLLHRDRPHPREALAGALWGESHSTQSRKYLRQALWLLHVALAAPGDASRDELLILEPGWVRLNPEAELSLDVAQFEAAFERVNGVTGQEIDAPVATALREAVEFYAGDLLEGCYAEWCLCERQRLQTMYLAMLDKVMAYCEARRDCEAGIAYGALALRCEPASERTHRRLMRLHYLAGDRTAALRQFERCAAALQESLGVRPSRRTTGLYEQLRGDEPSPPPPIPAARSLEGASSPGLSEVLGHLDQLKAAMAELHRQFCRDIELVERLLGAPRPGRGRGT